MHGLQAVFSRPRRCKPTYSTLVFVSRLLASPIEALRRHSSPSSLCPALSRCPTCEPAGVPSCHVRRTGSRFRKSAKPRSNRGLHFAPRLNDRERRLNASSRATRRRLTSSVSVGSGRRGREVNPCSRCKIGAQRLSVMSGQM